MKAIKIIGITEKGNLAIRKAVEDSLKANFIERRLRGQIGFNQRVLCENPFTLEIWATPGKMLYLDIVKPSQITEQMDEALLKNGATKEDYRYEVE